MTPFSLESNVKKILELAQDLINCEDEEVSHFGNAIADNVRQALLAIDDYVPSPSYDHNPYKEAYYGSN